MNKIVYALLFFLIAATGSFSQYPNQIKIKLGVDVLVESGFRLIKNKRVALLTNHAGRTRDGQLTAELFARSDEFSLTTIFTPEHGFYCTIPAGKEVGSESLYGVPVYSLYGDNRRPTRYQLSNCDVVVIDIQDIGIRSYTYISTMYKVMDACAGFGIPVIVLDRPNPMGGMIVDGNTVDKGLESFVGIVPVSYVHGCTIGELAEMINDEAWLPGNGAGAVEKCSLTVVRMNGWKRWMSWEDTNLMWFPTSPNIPTPDAIRGAAMLGIFGELGTISVGIGTSLPFQYIGTPDFQTEMVSDEIERTSFPGVEIVPAKYRPFFGKFSGKDCKGFLLRFPLDNQFSPYTSGIKLVLAIRKVHKEFFTASDINSQSKSLFIKVTGSEDIFSSLTNGASDEKIMRLARKGLMDFLKIRAKYLLYD